MNNQLWLSGKVSDPMLSFKDGGKVRWKCVWLNNWDKTAVASEWVNDDRFGRAWVERSIREISAERRKLRVSR